VGINLLKALSIWDSFTFLKTFNMKIPIYIKITEIITHIALCMFLFTT